MLTPRDLEEERRLFYVAMTRAKKTLTLSFADSRFRNGKTESNAPSRFLRELAPQYLDNPLRREEFEKPKLEEDESAGVRWRSPRAFGPRDDRKPAPSRSFTAAPVRSVMPGSDRASARSVSDLENAKPPIIDANFVPDPMSSFKVGDHIEHNRFGAGVMVEITGSLPDLKAKVRFDQYGEKLLLLKFAKIRHK